MMGNLMTIKKSIQMFRELINSSIIEGGNQGKTAMIRSSRPILCIHEAVKSSLVQYGVNPINIYPPSKSRTPELKLAGALKQKYQDICIVPNLIKPIDEILTNGLLKGTLDSYGTKFTNHTLVINVRSQISSIQKNFDTLYERTISESQNLHDRCPEICMGEVYLIAIPEYNDKYFGNNIVDFKRISQSIVEKYIKSFNAINMRTDISKDFYKYERVCLLIVDFSKTRPKLYNTDSELIKDGLLPKDTEVSIENLTFDKFVPSLLNTYESRFGKGMLS